VPWSTSDGYYEEGRETGKSPKEANLSPGPSQVLGRGRSNFVELRTGEVRRISPLGSWMNKGLLVRPLALRGRIGAQLQSGVSRLHRLPYRTYWFLISWS
jgi:hypothetical protein